RGEPVREHEEDQRDSVCGGDGERASIPAAARPGKESEQDERGDAGSEAGDLPGAEVRSFDGSAAGGEEERGCHQLQAMPEHWGQAPILVTQASLPASAAGDGALLTRVRIGRVARHAAPLGALQARMPALLEAEAGGDS